ncbi:conserved hypothetical protein [Cupriavidus necator]|uniref:Integrase catalytic domain-containing protein n=1 Tax=Cupriavidus necator TaxID=106590 RepID=A0A1K0IIP1_CUPNE|nr:conserved hypothetical protein [Cupriavidus necator]
MAKSRPLSEQQGALPMDQWPRFDPTGLSETHRVQFLRNQNAARLYMKGAAPKQIRRECGLDAAQVRRLVARCLQRGADDQVVGEAGLVPWRRLGAPCRVKPAPRDETDTGYAGAFSWLLRMYPSVEAAMHAVLIDPRSRLRPGSGTHPCHAVHAAFLAECARLGLQEAGAYPFNTQSLAVKSVAAYVRRYLPRHLAQLAEPMLGSAAAAKLRTGDGRERPSLALFERIECDAHLLDHAICVMVRHPDGHYVQRRLHRLWVVALVEVRSRAVLGYSLALGRQPNSRDLLDALHMALSPWHRYQRFLPDWTYSPLAGFPSEIAALRGMGFRQLSVDGARMNFAKDVVSRLAQLMDAEVVYLNRGTPDDRPYIERFFLAMEALGFHRLRGTTGSHAQDARRAREIDRITGRHWLDWQHVPAILDHVIAEYNGAPHSGLGDISPLAYLEQMGDALHPQCRQLSQDEIDSLQFVMSTTVVRGNLSKGRAPYIEFAHARYMGGPLAKGYNLVGQRVQLRVNAHDARFGHLFSLRGEPLGRVWAAPPWHKVPHALRLRVLIHKKTQARARHTAHYGDPIAQFAALSEEALARGRVAPDGYLALQRALAQRAAEACCSEQCLPQANAPELAGSSPPEWIVDSAGHAALRQPLPAPRPAAQRQLQPPGRPEDQR